MKEFAEIAICSRFLVKRILARQKTFTYFYLLTGLC